MMIPRKRSGKVQLVCMSCCHVQEGAAEGYRVVRKNREEKDVTIIDEKRGEALPTTKTKCPACGHDQAYWWMRQTRAADEPSTRFYKCVKCGKVWREYS